MPKFKFRQELKCVVTGFKGTVTSITETYAGQIRYGLQPKVKDDGTIPDAVSFDEAQVEPTAESPEGASAKWQFKFNYLDELEDIFTAQKGKVFCKVEFMNGCLRYGVKPTPQPGKKKEEEFYSYEQELKLVLPAEVVEEPVQKTGGPIEKVRY